MEISDSLKWTPPSTGSNWHSEGPSRSTLRIVSDLATATCTAAATLMLVSIMQPIMHSTSYSAAMSAIRMALEMPPVFISLMLMMSAACWRSRSITWDGRIELRDEASDLGGTMRLGGQVCQLKSGSKAREAYGAAEIVERHRHRYEVNNQFIEELEQAGLVVSGKSVDNSLVEVVELPDHPWYVACQFHPEFTSTPRDGHPLFTGFVNAALEHKAARSRAQASHQE